MRRGLRRGLRRGEGCAEGCTEGCTEGCAGARVAQTSLARDSRTVAAMPRPKAMPGPSSPASSVAAPAMAPAMEQRPWWLVDWAKPKPMTKPQIVGRIALQNNVTKRVVSRVLNAIASKTQEKLITKGTLRLGGFVKIKIVHKPPNVEYQWWHFGKIVTVKARPSRNIVKAVVLPKFRRYVAYRAA